MARGGPRQGATIGACLGSIGVDNAALEACEGLEQEFGLIKKSYFKQVLTCHPDKGGDPAIFREVQGAFEVLRDLYETARVDSFASRTSQKKATASSYKRKMADMADMPTPSWEYFAEAAEEPVPTYRVELAKSGRSACNASKAARMRIAEAENGTDVIPHGMKELIAKGDVRVGSIDKVSGQYGRWVQLRYWRVPSKVWLGLPDPQVCSDAPKFEAAVLSMNEVLLCGLSELPTEKKQEFLAHIMDKKNWAKLTKKRQKPDATKNVTDDSVTARPAQATEPHKGDAPASTAAAGAAGGPRSGTGLEVVPAVRSNASKGRQAFIMPVPGVGLAVPDALKGKTVVMTGVFPEVGGGAGLNLGKDKVKRMVQSFGGRVTGSISGRTDILIVGKEPGFSKVSQARANSKCLMLTLLEVKQVVEGAKDLNSLGEGPQMVIDSFSSGYMGNSLAYKASDMELEWVTGRAPEALPPIPEPKAPEPKAPELQAPKPKGRKPAKRSHKAASGDAAPPAESAATDNDDGQKRKVARKEHKAKADDTVAPQGPRVTRRSTIRKATAV